MMKKFTPRYLAAFGAAATMTVFAAFGSGCGKTQQLEKSQPITVAPVTVMGYHKCVQTVASLVGQQTMLIKGKTFGKQVIVKILGGKNFKVEVSGNIYRPSRNTANVEFGNKTFSVDVDTKSGHLTYGLKNVEPYVNFTNDYDVSPDKVEQADATMNRIGLFLGNSDNLVAVRKAIAAVTTKYAKEYTEEGFSEAAFDSRDVGKAPVLTPAPVATP